MINPYEEPVTLEEIQDELKGLTREVARVAMALERIERTWREKR